MATYHLTIENKSGVNQQYLLFNQTPVETPSTGSAFSNVWIRTLGTPSPTGKQHLTIKMDIFAMCGTLPHPLASGIMITETDETPVKLAGGSGQLGDAPIMEIVSGAPDFEAPYGTTSAANSFGITTKAWDNNKYKNKFWFGMGKYNDHNKVVPVASFPATPSQAYTLQPVIKFYVGTGSYLPGTAVNVTQIGSIGTIDFTKALSGQTEATITHKEDGTYSDPTFSWPPHHSGEPRTTLHNNSSEPLAIKERA